MTWSNMLELSTFCDDYHRLVGTWPTSISALSYMVIITNTNILADAWGRPFIFTTATNPSSSLWLKSYGADGIPGGSGSNGDLTMKVE